MSNEETVFTDELTQRIADLCAADPQLAAARPLAGVGAALDDATTSQNHLADAANQAAAMHNAGNGAGAHAQLQGPTTAALADFQQKVTALDQAVADAQAKTQNLKEVHHV